MKTNIRPGVYRHYKGNTYRVLHTALHSETLEEMVVYQDVNNPDKIWARPASMWNETVYVDGQEHRRFEWIGPWDEDVPEGAFRMDIDRIV